MIRSDYGSYSLNLGPNETGEFHEIQCVCINRVTDKFKEYRLEEVNEEYKKSCISDQERRVNLPKKVGGSEVQYHQE